MSIASRHTALQRKEFGNFLRSRRERLSPGDYGLPNGTRRRTPGLRREEVSFLAGVGTTWYTWLEQGRDVRASVEVLEALSQTLKLDRAEKHHLFTLHGRSVAAAENVARETVCESLQRMLDSLGTQPAYILGRRWDVLAWNRPATLLFGDYGLLEGDQRNIMSLLFNNPAHRSLLVDWKGIARSSLAMFRADVARYSGSEDVGRLTTALSKQSPTFKKWWAEHEVLQSLTNLKRIQHPIAGRMHFEYTSFHLADNSDRKLVVYTPLQELETVQKMIGLLN